MPNSALPIGATRAIKETQLIEVDPNEAKNTIELVNAVLAYEVLKRRGQL